MFNPMPDLSDNNTENTSNNIQEENRILSSDTDDHLAVETKTMSKTHCINWSIDSTSLHIAQLANKGDKRGVIEAFVDKETYKYKLELCVSGWKTSQDGYCAFYLTVQDEDQSINNNDAAANDALVARYRVQLGNISKTSSIRHDFRLGVGFPNYCELSFLKEMSSASNVNFLITVEIFTTKSNIDAPNKSHSLQQTCNPSEVISRLFNEMITKKLHTDITLVCRNYELPVHKCVLSHASPVFRAIFEHKFMENYCHQVCMHQWRPEIVELMIVFLYTGRIEEAEDIKKKFQGVSKKVSSNNPKPNTVMTVSIDSDDEDDEEDEKSQSYAFDINHNMMMSASPSLSESNFKPDGCDANGCDNSNILNINNVSFSDIVYDQHKDGNKHALTLSNNKINENITDQNKYDVLCDLKNLSVNNNDNNNNSNNEAKSEISSKNSGNKIKTDTTTFELFQLAEFYKIDSLVVACCQKMYRELTDETACNLLARIERFSHVSEIKAIKESTIEFIITNIKVIKRTTGYAQLSKCHPDILGQLIDQMTK